MLRTPTSFCLSHRLKHAASRTCRWMDSRLYPCSISDSANEPIYPASGPSGGSDRTTWLLMTHFTVDSFPLHGADGKSQDYVATTWTRTLGRNSRTRHSQEG